MIKQNQRTPFSTGMVIFSTFIILFITLITNANLHYHIIADGQIVIHSHFSKSGNNSNSQKNPSGNHHHNDQEILLLASLSTIDNDITISNNYISILKYIDLLPLCTENNLYSYYLDNSIRERAPPII